MKKYLLIMISLFTLTASAQFWDDIDPIGSDNWKTVIFTVKQLDTTRLSDALACKIDVHFGSKSANFLTSEARAVGGIVKKFTLPKRDNGGYSVTYGCPGLSYRYYFKNGTLEKGTLNIEIRLKRIDVNHMVVTDEDDGTTYVAPNGNVSITSTLWKTDTLSMKTGFGIDVPVGYQYKINVRTPTKDGTDVFNAALDYTLL